MGLVLFAIQHKDNQYVFLLESYSAPNISYVIRKCTPIPETWLIIVWSVKMAGTTLVSPHCVSCLRQLNIDNCHMNSGFWVINGSKTLESGHIRRMRAARK